MYFKILMATSLILSTSGEPFTYEIIEKDNKAPYKIKEFENKYQFIKYPDYVSNEEKMEKLISDLERMKKEKEDAERKAKEELYKKLAERQVELRKIEEEKQRKAKEEAERLKKLEEERRKQQESRTVSNVKTLTVNASAYTYAEQDPYVSEKWGNKTFTGKDVRFGYVAVDPNVIPLGTKMKIEGYGDTIFTAEDTGNAIKGYKLDIFLPSYDECIQFGRKNLKIYILN